MLSNKCMRHRLLSYFLNPKRQATEEHEQRFESEFERDVFRRITDKGFHVRTQVGVGDTTNHRYRIDLVVEGMQGRLAVECDGGLLARTRTLRTGYGPPAGPRTSRLGVRPNSG